MNKKQLLLVFLILWYTRFFSFLHFTIDESVYYYVSYFIDILILLFYWTKSLNRLQKKNLHFGNITLILVLTSFISIIPACLLYGQSPISGLFQLMPRVTFLLYFIFHLYRFTRKDILQVIIVLGVIYCSIKTIQQFTYPYMLFCEKARISQITGDVEMRNGFWRILMQGREFAAIMLYLTFEEFLKFKKKVLLILIILGVISIFLDLSRMYLFQMLLSLIIIYYLCNGHNSRFIKGCVVVLLAWIVFENISVILGEEMATQTVEQIHDTEDVRMLSYLYYWNESTTNPINLLIGHGPTTGTPTGRQLALLEHNEGLFRSDVGIVGILYDYGAIYCISLIICFVIFLYRVRNIPWVFAYQLSAFLFIILIPSLNSSIKILAFTIIMYLADIEMKQKDINNKAYHIS